MNPTIRRISVRSRIVAATVALATAGAFVTASAHADPTEHSSPAPASARGTLLWAEPRGTLSAEATKALLDKYQFSGVDVRNGIRRYTLLYRTVDPWGRSTVASGQLVVPDISATTLRPVVYTHGTTSYRADAPSSRDGDGFTAGPAVVYGAAGFVGIAPDYLGLGYGPGPQPWFDVPAETTASLDMLRAARTAVARQGRQLSPDLDITGFSQGASAALGLARTLQAGADPHFRVHALAPVSGGYDFEHVELPGLLRGDVVAPVAVPYVSYLLTSYQWLHHIYPDPHTVFAREYADRIEVLFNSNVPGPDLMAGLPDSLDELLTPQGRALLEHPRGAFRAALDVADSVCAWRPAGPVRLYYAEHDEQALTANTTSCRRSLIAHGAAVTTVDLGTPDYEQSRHLGSSVAAASATLHWFLNG